MSDEMNQLDVNTNQSISGDGGQTVHERVGNTLHTPREVGQALVVASPQVVLEEESAGSCAAGVQLYGAIGGQIDRDVKWWKHIAVNPRHRSEEGSLKERERDRRRRKTKRGCGDMIDDDESVSRRKRKKHRRYLDDESEDERESRRKAKQKRHKRAYEGDERRASLRRGADNSHHDGKRNKRPKEKSRHGDHDKHRTDPSDPRAPDITEIKQETQSGDEQTPGVADVTTPRSDVTGSPAASSEDRSHVQAMAEYRRRLAALLAADPLLGDLSCAVTPAEVRSLVALERGHAMAVLVNRGDKLTRVIVERTATVQDLKMALRSAVELQLDRQGDGRRPLSWRHVWRSYWLSHAGRHLTDDSAQLTALGMTNHSEVCFVQRIRRKRGQAAKKGGQIQDS